MRLGNKATGGPFAPLVVVVRNAIGEKEFNKLRGQAISAHSQSERSPGCGRVFDLVAPRATPAHATLHPSSHARLLLPPHTKQIVQEALEGIAQVKRPLTEVGGSALPAQLHLQRCIGLLGPIHLLVRLGQLSLVLRVQGSHRRLMLGVHLCQLGLQCCQLLLVLLLQLDGGGSGGSGGSRG